MKTCIFRDGKRTSCSGRRIFRRCWRRDRSAWAMEGGAVPPPSSSPMALSSISSPNLSLSLSLCFLFSLCVCVCVLVAFSFYRKKERKVWLVLGNFFGIGFVIVWVRRLKEKNDGNMARGGPDLGLSWEGPWIFFFLLFIYFFKSFLKQIINLVL